MLAFCPFYGWILDSVYKQNNVNVIKSWYYYLKNAEWEFLSNHSQFMEVWVGGYTL